MGTQLELPSSVLFPSAAGQSLPEGPPAPFSALPRHPAASAVSKTENLTSLASMQTRDPRIGSSVVPESISPTPAGPWEPQTVPSPFQSRIPRLLTVQHCQRPGVCTVKLPVSASPSGPSPKSMRDPIFCPTLTQPLTAPLNWAP